MTNPTTTDRPAFRNATNRIVYEELNSLLGSVASVHTLSIRLGLSEARVRSTLSQLRQRGLVDRVDDTSSVWEISNQPTTTTSEEDTMDITNIYGEEATSRIDTPRGERAPDFTHGKFRLHDNPTVGIMIYEDGQWIDTALSWASAFIVLDLLDRLEG